MRKPIDPNLNSAGGDRLLDITGDGITGGNKKAKPDFQVVDKEPAAKTEKSEAPKEETPEHTHQHSSGSSNHHHHHHHRHHHSSSGKGHSHSSKSGKRRSSKSSHSGKKSKLPVTARIAIAIVAVILILLLSAVAGFFVFRQMGKSDVLPDVSGNTEYHETVEYKGHTYKYNTDIVTIGFLGIDQRTFEKVENTSFVGAADADMVAAINTKTGEAKIISIPRDTMIDIEVYSPESGVLLHTQSAQLCLAYAYGDGGVKSCESTVDAMSRVLYNVPIQKYFALDLDGIAPLNDAIGGVTLVSQFDFPDYGIRTGDEVTLKGDMAEAYVRTRRMDTIDASLGRSQRQLQYINAYANQALPAVVNDFSTVTGLYNTASDYSKTNLTLSNATYLASLLLQKQITTFKSYSLKGEMKASDDPLLPGIVHAEFYPDEDSVMETVLEVFYTRID